MSFWNEALEKTIKKQREREAKRNEINNEINTIRNEIKKLRDNLEEYNDLKYKIGLAVNMLCKAGSDVSTSEALFLTAYTGENAIKESHKFKEEISDIKEIIEEIKSNLPEIEKKVSEIEKLIDEKKSRRYYLEISLWNI